MSINESNKIANLIELMFKEKRVPLDKMVKGSFSHAIPVFIPIGANDEGIDEFILLEDFSYLTLDGVLITAKQGFVFDGASIPKFAWSIIGHPIFHSYVRSALIHDILYGTEAYERKKCDELFEEMLYQDDTKNWKIPLMYYAVRVGGDNVWDEHIPEVIEAYKRFIEIRKV